MSLKRLSPARGRCWVRGRRSLVLECGIAWRDRSGGMAVFPLSIEGSIPARTQTETDVRALGLRICAEIKSLRIGGKAQGAVVSFVNDKQPFWKPFADRSIELVYSGTFTIANGRVRYSLSTMYFVVIGATLLSLPLVFCLVLQKPIGVLGVIGFSLFAFFYTYLSVTLRIRRALRRAIATPSPSLSPYRGRGT